MVFIYIYVGNRKSFKHVFATSSFVCANEIAKMRSRILKVDDDRHSHPLYHIYTTHTLCFCLRCFSANQSSTKWFKPFHVISKPSCIHLHMNAIYQHIQPPNTHTHTITVSRQMFSALFALSSVEVNVFCLHWL